MLSTIRNTTSDGFPFFSTDFPGKLLLMGGEEPMEVVLSAPSFTSFASAAACLGRSEHVFDFMTASAAPPENIIAFRFMGFGGKRCCRRRQRSLIPDATLPLE